MRALFFPPVLLRKTAAWLGYVAVVGAMASQASPGVASPGPAQAELALGGAVAVQTRSPEPMALEAEALAETLEVELPQELEDLREMGQQMGDRLGAIDLEVIQQVMRPLGREALQIFLDTAPGLSQRAIELGEQGLAKLEKRALERLEQAQVEFEREGEAKPGL